MSREIEIIKENYEKVFGSPPYDKSVNREMNQLYFIPAMQQYAKEMSIEFSAWVIKNNWRINKPSCMWFKDIWDGLITTEQLYEKYLESLK